MAITRARVAVSGSLGTERFSFRIEADLAPGVLGLTDAFVTARLSRAFSVSVGQLRVPFARSWTVPDHALTFVERPIAVEEFRYDWDLGLVLSGAWRDDRIRLQVGAVNGAGRNRLGNDNLDPMLFARVSGTPVGIPGPPEEGDFERQERPTLTLGAGATLDYVPVPAAYGFWSGNPVTARAITVLDGDGNGLRDGVRVVQVAGDATFNYKGFAAESEVYYRRESWGDIGLAQGTGEFVPNTRYGGFYVQALQTIGQRFQVGARFSFTELSPLTIGGRSRAQATCQDATSTSFLCQVPYADQRQEISAVASFFPHARTFRITATYSFLRWQTGSDHVVPDPNEHRVLVQVQAAR